MLIHEHQLSARLVNIYILSTKLMLWRNEDLLKIHMKITILFLCLLLSLKV